MEGQMREHGPLYTSVPFVMFDEGGWLVGDVVLCCGVVWCGGVGVVVVVASVCPSCWSDASHFHSNCGGVFDDS